MSDRILKSSVSIGEFFSESLLQAANVYHRLTPPRSQWWPWIHPLQFTSLHISKAFFRVWYSSHPIRITVIRLQRRGIITNNGTCTFLFLFHFAFAKVRQSFILKNSSCNWHWIYTFVAAALKRVSHHNF